MRHKLLMGLGVVLLVATACAPSRYRNSNVVDKTYIHRYGIEVPKEDWNTEGETGQVVSKMKNGTVQANSYSEGVLDGEATQTFAYSNAVERRNVYDSGELTKETENYRSGFPKKETEYHSPTKKTVTTWYESGSPQYVECYENKRLVKGNYYDPSHRQECKVDNGEGVRIQRDCYGQLICEDAIKDGEVAQSTRFHPNHSPKEITPYQNGVVEGQRKTFLPAGEPKALEEWKNDQKHGVTTLFDNGQKQSEIPYVNGKKEGVERSFNDEEKVVEETSWMADKKDGPHNTYIGGKRNTVWYYKGRRVSHFKYHQLRPLDEMSGDRTS